MAKSEIEMGMSLDSSGVKAGIEKTKTRIGAFADDVKQRFGKIQALWGKMFAATIGFAGFKKAIDHLVDMKRSADRLGVSVEMFQRLAHAAKQVGVDTDRLADAMKDLDVKLQDGIMRGGSFAELMQELGLNMEELAAMPADQRMLAFADAIQNASGSLSRFGADEFGDAMFEMLPLLEMGSKGILKLGEDATISSDAQIAAAERTSQFLDSKLSQITTTLSNWVANGVQLFEWLIAGLAQAVIEIGNVLSPMGGMLKGIFTLDFDLFKNSFNQVVDNLEGSLGRVKDAMNEVMDEQIQAERVAKHKQGQDAMTAAERARLKAVIRMNEKAICLT